MRSISALHSYYYIRIASDVDNSNGKTNERYDIIDINSVSSHMEQFKKRVPNVDASYTVNTLAKNADAALITALYDCKCVFNLNSITDVRDVVSILGIHTHLCCFAAALKSRCQINEAMKLGITRMTVSFPAEVSRISSVSNDIELVLQITPGGIGIGMAEKNEIVELKSSWARIIKAANSRGMKIVGISLRRSTSSFYIDDKVRISQTFSYVREAYDLVSACGHNVSFVDLGSLLSDLYCSHSAHKLCSILEELGDDDDSENQQQQSWESEDILQEDIFLTTLFEMYLPQSLGVQVFAHHAQYFVPDHDKIVKWWSMPRTRRPTASLHSYLAKGGFSSNTKSVNKCAAQA